jgi:hypothetical protein
MGYEEVMAVTAPLMTGAEAAAALAARMKLEALDEAGDTDVRAVLDRVVSALVAPGLFEELDDIQREGIVGTVTSFLKQALELIENPGRAGEWVYTDPVVLQSQGRAQAGFRRSSRGSCRCSTASPARSLATARASSTSVRASPRCRSPAVECGRPHRSSAWIRGSPR